ncbi:DUF4145 domain-containing protein [Methylicorpusculum oleiharenae]|uniref:DUF4145 domain-containing protein n=1 Tax=Methylicorpusculum oleiharenae TaxID=1338687 RepID=UPI0013591515|nr:DUF4145 domain-containing protein [Methylicorpusculum oleiharenae]MCD2452396.1 DUF4145 domain-containing protein [Methylicorpusculum oleiharenae]
MYIDSKKFDYKKFSYSDADRLVERDKKFLKEAYVKWINDAANKIVERQWEIDDIGVAEQSGDFVKLLKEAEFTYSLGAYTSAISLVGVCAEDLCRFFAISAGHNLDGLTQNDRVNRLHSISAITQNVADAFHVIRKLRNDCLHYNAGFKQKNSAALKADALKALNSIKYIYGNILGVVDYATIDSSKFVEIITKVTEEAANNDPGNLGIDKALIQTRNLFAQAFGFDMSMNNRGAPVYKMSIFEVLGIDVSSEPFEISLRDLGSEMVVIVDISSDEVKNIEFAKITEADIVAATLVSLPNNLEVTGEWRLWGEIKKIG